MRRAYPPKNTIWFFKQRDWREVPKAKGAGAPRKHWERALKIILLEIGRRKSRTCWRGSNTCCTYRLNISLDKSAYSRILTLYMEAETKRLIAVRVKPQDLAALVRIGKRDDRTQSYLV